MNFILRRCIVLFLTSIFCIIPLSCGAMPRAEPTPTEVAMMVIHPTLAIPPVSIPFLRLRFEAVFYLARVWLTWGRIYALWVWCQFYRETRWEKCHRHPSGWSAHINRIPVVIIPDWSFAWWNYGGITRDVPLEMTSQAYIARQQIVSIPQLTKWNQLSFALLTVCERATNRT